MTPGDAVALACAALGADPAGAAVLRAADAVTVDLGDGRVARVVGDDPAGATRVLAALPLLEDHVLEPLGPPVLRDGALVVPYPRVEPGLDGLRDLGMGGACLAGLHRIGARLAADGVDLPAFDPAALASGWLDRAEHVLSAREREALLAGVAEAWPGVVGEATVLHADAHPANWWAESDDWWRLIDPEFLSLGPAVYDLAPMEVVERRLGLGPSRFPSFLAGYEAQAGPVDRAALAAAVRVRELLAVAWLAARAADDSELALRVRGRLDDALAGSGGTWLA